MTCIIYSKMTCEHVDTCKIHGHVIYSIKQNQKEYS